MMEIISKNEFIRENSEYIFWERYDEIAKNVLKTLKTDIYDDKNSYDVLTPFKEGGKDWLLEYIYKYQPKTGKILKQKSKLFGGIDFDIELEYTEEEELGNSFLGLECNNMLIEIKRDFFGLNLSDNSEDYKDIRADNRFHSLPEEIKKSYFYRFSGFGTEGIGSVLPRNSWDSFDGYMESYKIPKRKHKEWYKWMEQFMPKFDLKKADGVCVDFMSFLDTRYEGSQNKIDTTLFVKTHLKDGVVYAIQNGDIEHIKVLTDPKEAIDCYCEYVLTTGKTNFDFSPYFEPLTKIRNEEKETILEDDDFEIVKVRVAYSRGRYIGNNKEMKNWYEHIKMYLDLHLLKKNLIKIVSENIEYAEQTEYLTEEIEEKLLRDLERGIEIDSISIFSLDKRREEMPYDAVVYAKLDKKEKFGLFQIWDDYTEETDMEEKLTELKKLIEPEIEEIFDWKCKNKFPYDYVRFGEKVLTPEVKINKIYKKTTV